MIFMRGTFLTQTGLSMVQGLIVGTMLAGTALVSTRLIQDQKKLQKATESRDQIEQFHRIVYATLQNREHCYATLFALLNPTLTVNVDQAARPMTTIKNITTTGTSVDAFQTYGSAGTVYMNGNVTIESMSFVVPLSTDPAGQNNMGYPSRIRIEYSRFDGKDSTRSDRRTKDGYGAKRIKKDIPIVIQRDASNNLTGCYAVQLGETVNGLTNDGNNNLNQEFCSNLGTSGSLYMWDSNTNRCVLKNNVCPAKYIFAGIGSTGTAICYPIGDFLPDMIDTTTTANCPSGSTVSLTTDASGRVKIRCN